MPLIFFWKLEVGDVAEVRRVVEQLRLKAVELGWLPVSEVIHLTDEQCVNDDRLPTKHLLIGAGDSVLAPHEVVFFTATPPGDEPRPFGLGQYPGHIEGSGQAVPSHLGGWCWVGVIRSDDEEGVKTFLHTAAQLGVEVTASFGGTVLSARRDETGQVRYEQGSGSQGET